MKRKNATRSALFTSIISLLLCVSMLVGTTFAWFTDTASTGINTITAGNLDIEVLYAYPSDVVDGEIPDDAWKVVDAQTPVFNKNALWEPGYTEVVYLKYVNKGSLSLQFQMHVDIVDETEGTNVAGKKFNLSDYIEAYVCGAVDYQFELYETRNEALNPPYAPDVWHGSLKEVANMAVATPDDPSTWLSLDTWNWLEPAEEYYTTLVLFMPTTVGNEANHKTGTTAPKIDLGINVVATQYNWENEVDSYDKDYDKDAQYPVTVNTADELAEALTAGKNVVLTDNVETDENVVMKGGTLDGNGQTIDAYDVATNSDCAITTIGGTVQNITITGDEGATRALGAGSSGTHTLTEDLYIKNVTIDKVMYAINGSGNGTQKVVVTDSTIYGWNSFSNIALFSFENCKLGTGNSYLGYQVIYGNTSYTNCTFEGFDMCADSAVVAGSTITFTNCTNDGVKVTAENFKELFMYPGDDVDFNKLQACTIIIDGVTVAW